MARKPSQGPATCFTIIQMIGRLFLMRQQLTLTLPTMKNSYSKTISHIRCACTATFAKISTETTMIPIAMVITRSIMGVDAALRTNLRNLAVATVSQWLTRNSAIKLMAKRTLIQWSTYGTTTLTGNLKLTIWARKTILFHSPRAKRKTSMRLGWPRLECVLKIKLWGMSLRKWLFCRLILQASRISTAKEMRRIPSLNFNVIISRWVPKPHTLEVLGSRRAI